MIKWGIKIFGVFPLPSGYQLQIALAIVHWEQLGKEKA